MSTFEVPILAIDDVYDHPNADRLSIIRVRGYEAISAKLEDGSHRFSKGEPIIYVPEGAVVPETHLKTRGFWNDEKGVGMLAGSRGDRVKAIRLRDVLSQGLVWKVDSHNPEDGSIFLNGRNYEIGADVADEFSIIKYEAPIPTSMSGDVVSIFEARLDFDIENLKAYPDLIKPGETVQVTEKLHGTFSRISFLPDLTPRDDLFGDGRVVIASKGLGARGIVFKDTEKNRETNVYVRALAGLAQRLIELGNEPIYAGLSIHLLGEVYGRGVQDLHYGTTEPAFRAFDFVVDGEFTDQEEKDNAFFYLGVECVPVLYDGPFSREKMDLLVDGTTTLGRKLDATTGPNIREGIVITAAGDQSKRDAGLGKMYRPILKHVSEAYLTRKGGSELQ